MPRSSILTPDVDTLKVALARHARCLHALMIREMMMRYGRDNLGFLWVFIEPMLLCVGVMFVWSLIGVTERNVPLVGFVLTGYMPLTLWRHMTNNTVRILSRNTGLLYHRRVSLLDVFFTRMALEFAGTTAAFLIVTLIVTALGLVEPPHDIGLVIAGWLEMAVLSIGAALGITVLTERWEVLEKFVAVFQYVTIPLCGFAWMVHWLPTSFQNAAWYVPSVHCFEMVRGGYFGPDVQAIYTPWYPACWGVGFFAVSIGFVEKARDWINA